MKTFVSALLTIALFSSSAFAQDKKAKLIDFDGDSIDGELIRPDGDTLDVNDIASHTSLIKIRLDFIKEIIRSAANL